MKTGLLLIRNLFLFFLVIGVIAAIVGGNLEEGGKQTTQSPPVSSPAPPIASVDTAPLPEQKPTPQKATLPPGSFARTVCQTGMAKDTGVTECDVDTWNRYIDIRVPGADVSSDEMKGACRYLADIITGLSADYLDEGATMEGWKLRIFSPHSGDHPTTICTIYGAQGEPS